MAKVLISYSVTLQPAYSPVAGATNPDPTERTEQVLLFSAEEEVGFLGGDPSAAGQALAFVEKASAAGKDAVKRFLEQAQPARDSTSSPA